VYAEEQFAFSGPGLASEDTLSLVLVISLFLLLEICWMLRVGRQEQEHHAE